MNNHIYIMNSHSSYDFLFSSKWETHNFINSSDLGKNNEPSILCLIIKDEIDLYNIINQSDLDNINIPTLYIVSHKFKDHIHKLEHQKIPHLFIYNEDPWGLIFFIDNIFRHYDSFKENDKLGILDQIDRSNFTKKELLILETLSKSNNYSVTRKDLYSEIWGNSYQNTNALDVHLCNLRKKLNNTNYRLASSQEGMIEIKI